MRHHWYLIHSILAAIPLADLAAALPPPWNHTRVMHMWDEFPADWEWLGYPAASTKIDLYIALESHRENALIDALYDVSDPMSKNYGKHLSKDHVTELVIPHPDTFALVNSWLQYHNVPPTNVSPSHGGNWLTLTGVPLSKANDLLGASYGLYRHTETNETIIRTISYALPVVLHKCVITIAPTTFFASPKTLRMTPHSHPVKAAAAQATAASEPREEIFVTPDYLRWLYNTVGYVPISMASNVLGILGLGNEYPSKKDLIKFMSEYRSDTTDATFTVVKVNDGGYDENHPGFEANLNVQYASAMTYPTPQIFYSVGGGTIYFGDTGEPAYGDTYLEWYDYLMAQPTIPQTISASYGSVEKQYPRGYAKAVCELFAQLGARGVSILFASGNDGVGAGDCKGTDGKVQFIPNFPASCPFVTSVGGTTSNRPEVAASISGGGFSNFFQRPDYQKKAVPTFLRNFGKKKFKGRYNRTGRGIPDIAAQALGYVIVKDNLFGPVDGTSAATPTAAGVISLINDFLISEKQPPLGFLNPFLYQLQGLYSGDDIEGLNDITWGSNPGCGTNGFSAVSGWDPVTGLGSPDFFELLHILVDLRAKQKTKSQPTD